jgi:hypothetical protein
MYVLVLILIGNQGPAMTTIPVPYEFKEQCTTAGEVFVANAKLMNRKYECISLKPLSED